jgi:hypothetical protein
VTMNEFGTILDTLEKLRQEVGGRLAALEIKLEAHCQAQEAVARVKASMPPWISIGIALCSMATAALALILRR